MHGQISKRQQTHAAHNGGNRVKLKEFECAVRECARFTYRGCVDGRLCSAQPRWMWLNDDEQIILKFLEQCGEAGASGREICRKAATKDRWKTDERWALPALSSLKDKKLVENSPAGAYRIPPKEEKKEETKKRF